MKRTTSGWIWAVPLFALAATPAMAHGAGGCGHTHPGAGSVCDDVGEDCELESGEEGRCRQFNRACLCVPRAATNAGAEEPEGELRGSPESVDEASGKEAEGRPALVHVHFEVQGKGRFTTGQIDTAKGDKFALMPNAAPMVLQAYPGPGARFDGWYLNGNYAAASPSHKVYASRNLRIKAVFASGRQDGEPGESAECDSPSNPESDRESRPEDDEADARICTRDLCDGCISSPACGNAQVGDACTLFGNTGTCVQIKTCPRLLACCGCRIGNRVFTGDGRVFSPEGRLLEEDVAPEGP